MAFEKEKLEIGDWIKGESKEGELIHGYIENLKLLNGTVIVTVVASDNERIIGKTIEILNKVEKLPFSASKTEEELMGLIDLSLILKDQEWFMELTNALNLVKSSRKKDQAKKVLAIDGSKAETLE